MAPGAHRMEWRPRHQHPVTLIGALSLTVAVAGASWVGCASLRDPFRITAQRVTASPAGPRARIQVDVTLTPHARARFLSLDGQLGVRGRDVAFKVDGLERGDLLIPGEPHTLSVTAVADAALLAGGVIDVVTRGGIPIAFDGVARVSVFGLPIEVPVTIRTELGLFGE